MFQISCEVRGTMAVCVITMAPSSVTVPSSPPRCSCCHRLGSGSTVSGPGSPNCTATVHITTRQWPYIGIIVNYDISFTNHYHVERTTRDDMNSARGYEVPDGWWGNAAPEKVQSRAGRVVVSWAMSTIWSWVTWVFNSELTFCSVTPTKGVVYRVKNGWGLTKVAAVLLNGTS